MAENSAEVSAEVEKDEWSQNQQKLLELYILCNGYSGCLFIPIWIPISELGWEGLVKMGSFILPLFQNREYL